MESGYYDMSPSARLVARLSACGCALPVSIVPGNSLVFLCLYRRGKTGG